MPIGDKKRIVAFRAGSFSPHIVVWLGAASFVVVVGLLEVLSRAGVIGSLFFPAPSAIGQALYELHASGLLWRHLAASLSRLAVGWSLGVSTGILAGLAIGASTWPRSLGVPWVAAISAIPKIALLRLFIIWFGIGEGSKYGAIGYKSSLLETF